MWSSTMARPDISNGFRAVAHHSHNPVKRSWKAEIKIITCLDGIKELGLTLVRGSGLDLTAYSDQDYADESNDRSSVLGTVVTLGGSPVG